MGVEFEISVEHLGIQPWVAEQLETDARVRCNRKYSHPRFSIGTTQSSEKKISQEFKETLLDLKTNISIGSVSPSQVSHSQISPNQISPNPETQIEVDYGEFSDKIPETNAMYDNIADRFQTFANEAGMGGAPQRHFDGGSFIQYAIDNGIWEQSVDDIYEHMVRKKLEGDLVLQQELQQQQQEIYPLSKNGRQCISQCKRDTNGNCYCDVEKYTGWTGTFDWDYCDDQYCNPLVPQ